MTVAHLIYGLAALGVSVLVVLTVIAVLISERGDDGR